jgi:hypothetical protein
VDAAPLVQQPQPLHWQSLQAQSLPQRQARAAAVVLSIMSVSFDSLVRSFGLTRS